ncbi:STAS domain-containing protein [Streptomyces sp. NPDC059009]|uniref:STAS domain-containing protein n=1 Tax=Streptomyces sp. NPDC059009 TaxID=3346694 RepID=UPI00369E79F3
MREVAMQGSAWPIGQVRIHEIDGLFVIAFHGDIDIAAAVWILPELDAATAPGGRTVVLDLTPVEFFDCYALRLLCRAERRVTERGGRVLLACPHPTVLKLLRVGGLLGRFVPLQTLDEALAAAGCEEAAG